MPVAASPQIGQAGRGAASASRPDAEPGRTGSVEMACLTGTGWDAPAIAVLFDAVDAAFATHETFITDAALHPRRAA